MVIRYFTQTHFTQLAASLLPNGERLAISRGDVGSGTDQETFLQTEQYGYFSGTSTTQMTSGYKQIEPNSDLDETAWRNYTTAIDTYHKIGNAKVPEFTKSGYTYTSKTLSALWFRNASGSNFAKFIVPDLDEITEDITNDYANQILDGGSPPPLFGGVKTLPPDTRPIYLNNLYQRKTPFYDPDFHREQRAFRKTFRGLL